MIFNNQKEERIFSSSESLSSFMKIDDEESDPTFLYLIGFKGCSI